MLVIDPMHNIYLGTAKHILQAIWIKNNFISTNDMKAINEKIKSWVISPEVRFNQLPAHIEYSSSFTAEQWMPWVNYYSINCLYGILPNHHLECWRHFVLASRLLCKQNMSMNDVILADTLLLKFCQRFQVLYGPEAVTPNIHLHAHLLECVKDYGPMCNFWLFSFERFNGLLGNEPTNNRSIELQLVNHFIRDNAHLQLLSSIPSNEADATCVLSRAVLDHALNFTSTRHLDAPCDFATTPAEFVPDIKHTISSFSSEMTMLTETYHAISPALFNSNKNVVIPQSYRTMLSGTVRGQKIKSGQYVLAHSVFPLPSPSSAKTYFYDPNLWSAKNLLFLFMQLKLIPLSPTIHMLTFHGLCNIHYINLLVNLMRFGAAH